MDRTEKLIGALVLAAIGGFWVWRPAGIRNNNPGNLMDVGIEWRGLIGRDSKGRARFARPIDGLRAMYIDLRTGFVRDAEDTVREIITEWAPPPGNPTAAYIDFVSRALNVSPDQRLELASSRVPLLQAIIQFENGVQPYPVSMLERAIAEA